MESTTHSAFRWMSEIQASSDAMVAEYDALPESVKLAVSLKEYAWMGPTERSRLLDDFCMPEPEGD
jgi:hypothetical protein